MNPAQQLTEWYAEKGRKLPWREEKDPYRIWISEIILQQTRISQGTAYYLRFIERFPDLPSLAAAAQDEVLKAWEGLGYYSRARNLHSTAQHLMAEYGGKFPEHYSQLLELKGIGPYTARAIGSLAFGNSTGVLDGNVFRVMSRYTQDFSPIDLPATRKKFQAILDEWVQTANPAIFNQAMMDLGAMICIPGKPDCRACPLQAKCLAYRDETIPLLPFKAKKLIRKVRHHNFYLVYEAGEGLLIRKRAQKGIWAGLWEIPNEEVLPDEWETGDRRPGVRYLGELKHIFTHFDMNIRVYAGSPDLVTGELPGKFISTDKIPNFAFSKAVLKIFNEYLREII